MLNVTSAYKWTILSDPNGIDNYVLVGLCARQAGAQISAMVALTL